MRISHNVPTLLRGLDLVPLNGRVARQHAKTLSRREFLIDDAHKGEKLFIESRQSAHWLRRVAPNFLDLSERHILSGYKTVQDRLVQRVAALDCDVVHFFRKSRVADQQKNEIVQIFLSMV